jgi:CubicO group peptidase (beta-lactamase class C family)
MHKILWLVGALLILSTSVVNAAQDRFISLLTSVKAARGVSADNGGATQVPNSAASIDFTAADTAFENFLLESSVFDGISYVVVNADGIMHKAVFGDHAEDLVVMLASTSKVPAVMTLLALHEDPNVQFTIDQPVATMLSYEGIYTDRTVEQMVSNTSGIPGLAALEEYGSPFGQTLETVNHLCAYVAADFVEFEACGEQLLTSELPNSRPAGEAFDYGGSQWQAAGVTAAVAANATWNQLVDKYLVVPCELEVFTFGNPWQELSLGNTSFNGTVESLPGQTNPNIEGGAITNLDDYAKLLQVHLNGGFCGETQILSEASLASMREDRGGIVATDPVPYGMGWWISTDNPGVYDDPGAFGAISFIDIERGLAGYVAIDDYSQSASDAPVSLVRETIIPLLQSAYDDSL